MNPIFLFVRAYWFHGLLFIAGLALGGTASHIYDTAQIATVKADMAGLKAQHSEDKAVAVKAAIDRLQSAQQRADELQAKLDKTEQSLSLTKQEVDREIKRNTNGTACLNSRTVGLLNHSAASGSDFTTLPGTSGGSAEPGTGFTTDTDIAIWINDTVAQYNTCRARLDALIDWHLPNPATTQKHD